MVGRLASGTGCRPRLTFWLNFFQSYMLLLFFNGLLSYLVGMKRGTSRCSTYKRENSLSSLFKKLVHNAVRHFSCSHSYYKGHVAAVPDKTLFYNPKVY